MSSLLLGRDQRGETLQHSFRSPDFAPFWPQVEGTFHFRTTFLPSEHDIGAVCDRLSKFHADFIKKYGSPEE